MSVEPDPELAPNTLVNGRYKIVRVVGQGGMGRVYLAEDMNLRRKVALKLLSNEVSKDQELAQRFIHEAQNASRINHPNVVAIFDKGLESELGKQFLVTEFVDGITLKDYLSTKKPTLFELANIALQVAEALTAAHQVGVVHRDIKPGNIMLLPNGTIKVLDFGLSKFVSPTLANQGAESITPLAAVPTLPGTLLGTPSYMSPEQARNSDTDSRTDVFSFGIVLYQLATGELPFQGSTKMDVIASILNEKYPPLERYLPNPPDALERIIFKCLQKDIEKRYQSFDEAVLDLKELRQQVAPEIRETKEPARARFLRYVRRGIKIVLAVGVLIGLAFLARYLFVGPSAPLVLGGPLAGIPALVESDFDDQVSSSDVPVLVFAYFYSTNYGAANADAPVIGNIAKRYGGRLRVLSVDTDVNKHFKERFKTSTDAAAILFKRGVELARFPGAFSEEALVKLIEDNYERAPLISGDQANESPRQTVIEELIESDFTKKVINSKVPVLLLVSYGRSGPGPYQSIRSVLERIARNNPDKIKILWLDTSDNLLLAYKLDSAGSSPHLLLFKNGKRLRRLDGNASEDAIMVMLEGYVTLT
jgi:thioredoxin-like negative regulator of GroEL